MKDFRLYADTIKKAVARERSADSLWTWRVKAITKKAVRISWEYLEYLGDSQPFTIRFVDGSPEDDESLYFSIDENAAGLGYDYDFISVGPSRYDDAHDIEQALSMAVYRLGVMARNAY